MPRSYRSLLIGALGALCLVGCVELGVGAARHGAVLDHPLVEVGAPGVPGQGPVAAKLLKGPRARELATLAGLDPDLVPAAAVVAPEAP